MTLEYPLKGRSGYMGNPENKAELRLHLKSCSCLTTGFSAGK